MKSSPNLPKQTNSAQQAQLSVECPICACFIPAHEAELHANTCLDGLNHSSCSFNYSNRASSEASSTKPGKPTGTSLVDYKSCPLCSRTISSYDISRKEEHVNKCLDSVMLSESVGIKWKGVSLCPSCDRPWGNNFTLCSKLNHLKKCGKSRGLSVIEIVEIVKKKVLQGPKQSQPLLTQTQKVSSKRLNSTQSSVTIDVSSDDDFVSQKLKYRQTHIQVNNETTFQHNKANLKLAKALSLSIQDKKPLQYSEIITKKKRKPTSTTNELLVGQNATAYMNSKIRSLKVFAEFQNISKENSASRSTSNHSNHDDSNSDRSSGLRKLSVMPDDPFLPFFKPYSTEIEIKENLNANEVKELGFRIQQEYSSRIDQTRQFYQERIQKIQDHIKTSVEELEKERNLMLESINPIQRSPSPLFYTPEDNLSSNACLVPDSDFEECGFDPKYSGSSNSILKAESPLYLQRQQNSIILVDDDTPIKPVRCDNYNDPLQYSPLHSRHFSEESVSDDFSETVSDSDKENKNVGYRVLSASNGYSTPTASHSYTHKAGSNRFFDSPRFNLENVPSPPSSSYLTTQSLESLSSLEVKDDMHSNHSTESQKQAAAMLNAGICLPKNYTKLSHQQLKEIASELGIRPGTKTFILSELAEIERLGLGQGVYEEEGEELRQKVYAFLKQRHFVWSRIVRYEPLKVDTLYREFHAEYKCNKKSFCEVLDRMGIHYIEEGGR